MSGPMSNPEIEDVLSSIRRLVSEDLRPAARGAAPVAAPEPAEKLLLTPALRIPDPAPEEGETVVPPEALVLEQRVVPAVENVVSRLGAKVAEDDWESPFGDPEVWPGILPPPGTLPPKRPRADQAGVFVHRPAHVLRGGGTDPLLLTPMVDARAEVGEPTVVAPSPPAGSATTQGIKRAVASEPPVSDTATGDTVVDASELRDLVHGLIRQELAGDLGEHITRTVRKLVRAEIARAMTLRDLE